MVELGAFSGNIKSLAIRTALVRFASRFTNRAVDGWFAWSPVRGAGAYDWMCVRHTTLSNNGQNLTAVRRSGSRYFAPCVQEAEGEGLMSLILMILRLLFGWIRPSWDEALPLAIRRDGRLESRPDPWSMPRRQPRPAIGQRTTFWRAMLRALGHWYSYWFGPRPKRS
jgi:hypothetical protein